MYKNSIYFQCIISLHNKHILRMFFEDWTDGIGDNEVRYVDNITNTKSNIDIIKVKFTYEEDALAMKLKGIPDEFIKYIKPIEQH